jgi:hypothetical protein
MIVMHRDLKKSEEYFSLQNETVVSIVIAKERAIIK